LTKKFEPLKESEIMLVEESGVYILWPTSKIFIKTEGKFHSIGCGSPYALAAMECGKSSKEAVEIAAKLNCGTGGEIHELVPSWLNVG
jgi:ATP-dependent protease HslVU (ClpYQ) peptidase subunit